MFESRMYCGSLCVLPPQTFVLSSNKIPQFMGVCLFLLLQTERTLQVKPEIPRNIARVTNYSASGPYHQFR
jgi:hypothetical protein